jgi:hypothetical protein
MTRKGLPLIKYDRVHRIVKKKKNGKTYEYGYLWIILPKEYIGKNALIAVHIDGEPVKTYRLGEVALTI